jgi:hypothetical protein
MRRALAIVAAVLVAVVALILGGCALGLSQETSNLGVKDGRPATCPSSLNCVSSRGPADARHHIHRSRLVTPAGGAARTVAASGGWSSTSRQYLRAEFATVPRFRRRRGVCSTHRRVIHPLGVASDIGTSA